MTIGCIVLAAGLARRMGHSKLDLLLDGKPVLAHVLERIVEAGLPLLVVTGGHGDAVRRVAGDACLIDAPDHAAGLAASLAAGVAAAPEAWSGLLVALGDMPFVRSATYRALADSLMAGADAVVPVQGTEWGNPAGFSRRHFPALLQLAGDAGARALLRRIGAAEIWVDDAGIHRDIDCLADLPGERLQ